MKIFLQLKISIRHVISLHNVRESRTLIFHKDHDVKSAEKIFIFGTLIGLHILLQNRLQICFNKFYDSII